jgi:hypothetical protein
MQADSALSPQRRVQIALLIGFLALSFSLSLRILTTTRAPANDMYWPFCAGQAFLRGLNPYTDCAGTLTTNMFPTALLMVPLLPLGKLAPSLIWGVSSGLLAYGLLRDGKLWRLLIFASGAYWEAAWWLQWSPLILAIALLPALYPLLWVKPHIGLPVAIMRFRWRGVLVATALGMLSLLLLPTWPQDFIARLGGYTGAVPAYVFPPLLLSLLTWRREEGRWLALSSLVPLRSTYDTCILWMAVPSPLVGLLFVGSSWLLLLIPLSGVQGALMSLALLVPLLITTWRDVRRSPDGLRTLWPVRGS